MRWARDITHFSGYAGEVVKGVIYPTIWLALIPVFFAWLAVILMLTVMVNVAPELVDSVMPIISFLVSSYLVGRFAIGAASGDVNSGFLNPNVDFFEPIYFAIRSAVLLLIWLLPIYGAVELLSALIQQTTFSAGALSFYSVMMMFLGFLAIVGFPLSWLLATATSSFAEIFSATPWVYVYTVRRRDLPIFLSAIIGGGLIFLGLYCIPCLYLGQGIFTFVVSLSVQDQAMVPMMSAFFGWIAIPLVPAMVSPILIGRLCGAFMQGIGTFDEETTAADYAVQAGSLEVSAAFVSDGSEGVAVEETANGSPEEFLPEDDPSDAVITWAKAVSAELEEVASVRVLKYSAEGVTGAELALAIEIGADTKLARQQEVKRLILEKNPPGQVIFVNIQNEEEIQRVGTLIYRRK